MPNHVTSSVGIYGPEEDIKEYVRVSTQGYEVKEGNAAEAKAKHLMLSRPGTERLGEFSFGALTGVPDNFASDWYDWSHKNWGTKWDAYSFSTPAGDSDLVAYMEGFEGERLSFQFDTAWAAPLPYWKTALRRFPRLTFTTYWEDEGGPVGWFVLSEGAEAGGHYDYDEVENLAGPRPTKGRDADWESTEYEEWEEAYLEYETRVRDALNDQVQAYLRNSGVTANA